MKKSRWNQRRRAWHGNRHANSLVIAGALLASSASAQVLEPIMVSSPRIERDLTTTPQAVGVIDVEDIQQGRQGLQLDESLNRLPGVYSQNRYNFAQNLRVSIRGFGARAPFGVRGLRVFVDGLPETLPDGQSQVDAIDLESVERIEVIRGPSSALYGNATGGVLDIRTMDGPPDPYVELRLTAGEEGFQRYGLRAGGDSGVWNAHISAWDLEYDGFRDQSRTEKRMLNTKARLALDAQRSLTGVLTVLDQPVGQDAGGLTLAQVEASRTAANLFSTRLDAGQTVEQERIGLIYEDESWAGGILRGRTFYTQREFEQQLPFPGSSRPGFSRDFYGVGLDYTRQSPSLPLLYQVGVEYDKQEDDRLRRLVSPTGVVGRVTQNELQEASSLGVFSQVDVALSETSNWTVAGRFDRIELSIDDRLASPQDLSGSRSFDELSASTGLSVEIAPDQAVYASIGTAFETPTFTEFSRTGVGGFNPDIEPQRATNLEAGMKGFLASGLRYDVTVFTIRTDDEIVNVQTDQNEYSNAGETTRNGLELGLDYFATDTISLSAAYTWSDFTFDRFVDGSGARFDGNRLPGLPRHALFGELAWRDGGWFAILDALWVDSMYADNANAVAVDSYSVLNTRAGVEFDAGPAQISGFVALNNLLDEEYFGNLRVNAAGARYYEPAPGRNVVVGLRARF